MASIRKRVGSTGTTHHVQIRRKGLKPLTKSFFSRTLAQQWARQTESALERSEYLDLTEAKTTKVSKTLSRYSDEVAIKLKVPVTMAVLAVAITRLAVDGEVLGPEQLQRHALALEGPMHLKAVGLDQAAGRLAGGKQQGFEPGLPPPRVAAR